VSEDEIERSRHARKLGYHINAFGRSRSGRRRTGASGSASVKSTNEAE
jgi:hypothetical protein